MRVLLNVLVLLAAAAVLGCGARHGGPVIDTGSKPAGVGGTIAGTVRSAGSKEPLIGRKVTAIDVATGARYEASTATNGGYTLKVPTGTYRLEVELHAGESLAEGPRETEINMSDLDTGRDFLIAPRAPQSVVRAAGGSRRTSSSRASR